LLADREAPPLAGEQLDHEGALALEDGVADREVLGDLAVVRLGRSPAGRQVDLDR